MQRLLALVSATATFVFACSQNGTQPVETARQKRAVEAETLGNISQADNYGGGQGPLNEMRGGESGGGPVGLEGGYGYPVFKRAPANQRVKPEGSGTAQTGAFGQGVSRAFVDSEASEIAFPSTKQRIMHHFRGTGALTQAQIDWMNTNLSDREYSTKSDLLLQLQL